MHKYADYQDVIIIGEYSDEGKSGKSVEGRPQFQQMLQDIETGNRCCQYQNSQSGLNNPLKMVHRLTMLRGCDETYVYELTRDALQIDDLPDDWQNEENYQHSIIIKAKDAGIGYRRWKHE